MLLKYYGIFTIFLTVLITCQAKLEQVKDEELMSLITTEKYVVTLFSKRDCEACDNFENELSHLREDLVDSLNAWVVKAMDSQLTRLYSPSREPALVFFRHGVPLLYDGPLNDELILHTITDNKEPIVKELSDENFEHLTQAASGATTGDWFVMFYTNDCVDCQRFQARWEAVGAKLKTRLNVARMNRGTTGAATARRFDVFHVPAFILFRQGKMYRYQIQKYDVSSFVSFAQDWYKNMKPEKVPVPKTPFDDLTTLIADYFKENPWLLQITLAAFVLGIIAAIALKRVFGPAEKNNDKPKVKKQK